MFRGLWNFPSLSKLISVSSTHLILHGSRGSAESSSWSAGRLVALLWYNLFELQVWIYFDVMSDTYY